MLKKVISVLLAMMFVLSMTACSNETKPENGSPSDNDGSVDGPNEVLDESNNLKYSSDEELLIYPYGGVPGKLRVYDKQGGIVEDNIPISDEQLLEYYKQIKDAGMNMTTGGYINMTYKDYVRGLKVCEKVGLKMMVYDTKLVNILRNERISDSAAIDQILSDYYELFESPAFAGISVDDEPGFQEIPTFKTALKRWKLIQELMEKEYIFYINLFPSIAFSSSKDGKFEDYIKCFVDNVDVDYVCYDHYPLVSNGRKNTLLDNFLYNLTTVKSNSNGRRCFTVLQSIQYGGNHRKLLCEQDVTFQVYSALACGFEGFGWFCFWPPVPNDGVTNFGHGAYDRQTNQPNDTYYYIKDGLNEIRKLEDVYFNFEWQGIKTVIGSENSKGGENYDFALSEFAVVDMPRIESVKTQQDTVIGAFKDKDGNDGFMIVNFTEPTEDLDNKVVLKLKDCTKAAVWENGEQKVYKVNNGILTLNQKGGDGFFVVPIK